MKAACAVCNSTTGILVNVYGICRKCEKRYEYILMKIAKNKAVPIDFFFRDKYREVVRRLELHRTVQGQLAATTAEACPVSVQG